MVYEQSHLIAKQLDPKTRYADNSIPMPKEVAEELQSQAIDRMLNSSTLPKDKCRSLGMDQGFHNWLVYSGILNDYLNVRIYQQVAVPRLFVCRPANNSFL
jgi:hypothetical protein